MSCLQPASFSDVFRPDKEKAQPFTAKQLGQFYRLYAAEWKLRGYERSP